LKGAESFWREELRGFDAPTRLRTERAAPDDGGGEDYHRHHLRFTSAETEELQNFARGRGLTVNTLVQAAWALLLSRHSGSRDVLFGAVVSGRPGELTGVETMVGPFINTLPVRVRVEGEGNVLGWLLRLQARQSEMRQYEYSPLVEVQGWSEVPRGTPLFDSFLNFLNYPTIDSREAEWSGSLKVLGFSTSEKSNYALTVDASLAAELTLDITADGRRVDPPTASRMLEEWGAILRALAARPEATLESLLNELEETERQRREKEEDELKAERQKRLTQVRRRTVTDRD
jgi:non-ribosomal peptide synthetase component F